LPEPPKLAAIRPTSRLRSFLISVTLTFTFSETVSAAQSWGTRPNNRIACEASRLSQTQARHGHCRTGRNIPHEA
jgi:hypothetical protein